MDTNRTGLSAILLCDRHDAQERALAPWPAWPTGRRALEHLVGLLAPRVEALVLVSREPSALLEWDGLIVAPPNEDSTLADGLDAGLAMTESTAALVVALDSPWLAPALLDALFRTIPFHEEAVMPFIDDRPRPFPGLYKQSCRQRIMLHRQRGIGGMAALIAAWRVRPLSAKKVRQADPAMKSFETLTVS